MYHCNTNCTHIYLSKIGLFVFVFSVFSSYCDLLSMSCLICYI